MKKTLLTAAAVLISASALAQVTSANVVGYVKQTSPAAGAFDLMALTQFSDGSTNDAYDIQTIISNVEQLNADVVGSNYDGADKMYVYNGAGYDQYALFTDGVDTYWASINEFGWIPGFEGFGVAEAVATIPRGTACWLATGNGGTSTNVISSGEVLNDETYDVAVGSGFSLLSYPYSSSINLTNLVITGATADVAGSNYENADKLYVYNGAGYDQYALFTDGVDTYWASINEFGWIPGFEGFGVAPANAEIELGGGFWFYTGAGKTITFNKIYDISN